MNKSIIAYLATIGARGGSVKSPAKAKSSAANGSKGGRRKGSKDKTPRTRRKAL